MDLFEAHKEGWPLVIDTGDGGERLMAELFEHPQGIVFADIGWPDSPGHPFHTIEGDVVRVGEWRVGQHEIRVAFEGEKLYKEWLRWQAWRETPQGRKADTASALENARADGRFN